MKILQNILFFLIIPAVLVLPGCSKNSDSSFTDLPVVESYLIPGSRVSVKISQKTPYLEEVAAPTTDISRLNVKILYHDMEYLLTSMGSGLYADTAGVIPVISDSSYTLSFSYNGLAVASTTIIPASPANFASSDTSITFAQLDFSSTPSPGSTVTPVTLSWSNTAADYYMITVQCIDSNAVSVIKDSIPEDSIFTSPPFNGDEAELRPMTFKYFGRNRVVLYHLNPEYSTFFSQPVSTTQNYQDPPTNIVNGLGIFTGLNTDTLYIRVIQK